MTTKSTPSEALRAADRTVRDLKEAIYNATQNRLINTATNLQQIMELATAAGLKDELMAAYEVLWDVQAKELSEFTINPETIVQHTFSSTGAAYDACQYRESIKKGDILLIPSEGVVGIADTWPFAVSPKNGQLHRVAADGWDDPYTLKFAASIALGRKLYRDTLTNQSAI